MLPAVTVISALYNAETEVPELATKLEALDHPRLQIVLIDDASTDATWAAIEEFAARDSRVVALRNPANLGVGGARNRALKAATSEYIWFVDHDDDWFPDAATLLARAAGSSGADIVSARAEYRHRPDLPGRIIDGVDERRTLTRDEYLRMMLAGNVHGFLWSKLIRRAALGDAPFPSLTSQSDFVGLLRALSSATTVVVIPDVVYRYLRRQGSLTRVRTPRLSNLEAARDAMHEAIAATKAPVEKSLVDYFDAWFYAGAAAFTPIRWNAPHEVRRDGIRRARAASAQLSIGSLLRRSRGTAATIALVRYAPGLYRLGLPFALRVKDRLRDARATDRGSVHHVAYVGIHDPDYPRNLRIRSALNSGGLRVVPAAKSSSRGARGVVADLAAVWRASRGARAIVVSEFGLKLAPAAWAVSRLRRVPLIVDGFVGLAETHIDDWGTAKRHSPRGIAFRSVDALAATLADAYLVDTDLRADAIVRRYRRRSAANTFSIPVGAPAWAASTPLPVADETLRVLYYGNYIPLHGLPLVVRAIDEARRHRPLSFTLIGGGQGRAGIERAVSEAGLGAITTFEDPVPEAELRDRIAAHDVVLGVFGSSGKARSVLANKLWQGLACGRVVITQSSPALSELRPIVGDQLVGTVPGDAGSLADALTAVDPSRRFEDRAALLEEYVDRRCTRLVDWVVHASS
ncbi:glycosyltransferase [Microbacterium sp. X-17]|uniref:glycosyltransferase n=1 Tax=Microbacterium sp. X-17 TaxID=3144404 RepID=UPI0031F509AC